MDKVQRHSSKLQGHLTVSEIKNQKWDGISQSGRARGVFKGSSRL